MPVWEFQVRILYVVMNFHCRIPLNEDQLVLQAMETVKNPETGMEPLFI